MIQTFWPRAIILIDMNAFFASVEQLDYPELRGQPVGVTNGEQGTCIITCSYEARAFGIKTGMRLKDAKKLCPRFVQRPARPRRYAAISTCIMQALQNITPDIEIFSVDEAFLDVTRCQRLFGSPELIGRMTQQIVREVSGLHCSVGVSGDKTTAKYAAKVNKPNGFCLIPPWEAKERLRQVPVTELCGIAGGIGGFLAQRGVHVCGDMEKLPISVLGKRFGHKGRRIWFMCQGADPEPLSQQVPAPKSMGHGKVIPPNTRDETLILTYLQHMSEKLAARLRRHQLMAQVFSIGLRHYELGWIGSKARTVQPTHDGALLFQLCRQVLAQCWHHEPVGQVHINALDPQPANQQLDLFAHEDMKRRAVNRVMDSINARYGEFTIAPANLLNRSSMPNVIAPSWKPEGHRQTV